MMRRLLCIIVMMFFASLMACGKEPKFKGTPEGLRYSETYQIVSVAPEGVVYKGRDGMIYFRATGTNEEVILCYDPNCIHEPASPENPDPTCKAALFNDRTEIAYYEGNIYYFLSEGIYGHKIYKKAVNGAGRKAIATIPYSFDTLRGVIFYEDKMYYNVVETVPLGEDGELIKKFYILEYDLVSGKYKLVTPHLEDIILDMQVTKDYIYIRLADVSNEGKVYVSRFKLENAEEEIFISTDEYPGRRFIRAYDEQFVYLDYLESGNEIGISNIADGKDKVLISIKDAEVGSVWASGNGIIYFLYKKSAEGERVGGGVFFYDMLTGETTDITEKALERGIMKYDGYKKIFICNSLYNTSVISEEEVLGKD